MATIDEAVGQIVIELRDQISTVECVPGCHDCCGPAPCTNWEYQRMGPEYPVINPESCAYLGPEGCTCYTERPIICRLYAVIDDLPCPYGVRPSARLSHAQQQQIIKRYRYAVKIDNLQQVARRGNA